jgi:nucleoside-diphosphate-sugar epimerase
VTTHDTQVATSARVLVTGVDGFIGPHVTEALVRDGGRVGGLNGFTDSCDGP